MMAHPALALLVPQGMQRGTLISGRVIYQAAFFNCVPVLR